MPNLYNRESIGYEASVYKYVKMVRKVLYSIKYDLRKISLFHTNYRNEFKNRIIEEALKTFDIRRSLNHKGCPYHNSVVEATYKTIKTEFVFNKRFENLRELERELFDYANWYNNV